MSSLLNKDALRAMRDQKQSVELGTVSFKIEKAKMLEFNELQKDLVASGIRKYPKDEIFKATFELIIELMKEDLEKKTN